MSDDTDEATEDDSPAETADETGETPGETETGESEMGESETEDPETGREAAQEPAEREVDEGGTGEVEADEEDVDEEEADGLQPGDFVRLAYTARTVDGDQLVDTTDPEVAEEEGVDDQGTFEPRVIVLGEGHLFQSVEDDVVGGEVGDSGSVSIPAAEAFGEYDDENVRTVAANKIPEDDRHPGAQVQIDGDQGYLETIIGGRARVDFNHPLAGEDIEYEYEIVGEVTDQLEQAEGLLNMFLDMDLEMWIQTDEVEETRIEQPDEEEAGEEAGDEEAGEEDTGDEEAGDDAREPETVTETVEKTSLYVEATPQLSMNQQWMFQKQQIAQQIIDKTGIDRIVVQEILDGMGGMGMGGMMGGMGGMGAGGAEGADLEAALEDADVDADDIVEEIEE